MTLLALPAGRRVALVAGLRTAFAPAGGRLARSDAVSLARHAIREVVDVANIETGLIDEVVLGLDTSRARTVNVARAAARAAGIAPRVPAFTVNRGRGSGLEAVLVAAQKIALGAASIVVAGGVEAGGAEGGASPSGRAASAFFRPGGRSARSESAPEAPPAAGSWSELRAAEFGVTRAEQDAWAAESHRRAAGAWSRLSASITPLPLPPWNDFFGRDEGPREDIDGADFADATAFREGGAVTPANSARPADGAAVILLAREETARSLGLAPLAYLRSFAAAGVDAATAGLAPVAAVSSALEGASLSEMGVIEWDEPSAAELLSCERACASRAFAARRLGRSIHLGEIAPERLNADGGSIALGDAAGATGARLVIACVAGMERNGASRGLVALSATPDMGLAAVWERD